MRDPRIEGAIEALRAIAWEIDFDAADIELLRAEVLRFLREFGTPEAPLQLVMTMEMSYGQEVFYRDSLEEMAHEAARHEAPMGSSELPRWTFGMSDAESKFLLDQYHVHAAPARVERQLNLIGMDIRKQNAVICRMRQEYELLRSELTEAGKSNRMAAIEREQTTLDLLRSAFEAKQNELKNAKIAAGSTRET